MSDNTQWILAGQVGRPDRSGGRCGLVQICRLTADLLQICRLTADLLQTCGLTADLLRTYCGLPRFFIKGSLLRYATDRAADKVPGNG